MAVSKRTRFEVLRRDNHTCRYCRATDAPLTIDHVTPVALGGTDDPSNLVTACRDCNAGKSSTSPDAQLVANVSDDAIRWASAKREAARLFDAERTDRRARVQILREAWIGWDEQATFLPIDWEEKCNHWIDAGITMHRILDAFAIASGRNNVPDRSVFAYMCGVIRNWVADINDRAQLMIDGEDADEFPTADDILVDFIDRFGRELEAV
jgi:hypothetical protein